MLRTLAIALVPSMVPILMLLCVESLSCLTVIAKVGSLRIFLLFVSSTCSLAMFWWVGKALSIMVVSSIMLSQEKDL